MIKFNAILPPNLYLSSLEYKKEHIIGQMARFHPASISKFVRCTVEFL